MEAVSSRRERGQVVCFCSHSKIASRSKLNPCTDMRGLIMISFVMGQMNSSGMSSAVIRVMVHAIVKREVEAVMRLAKPLGCLQNNGEFELWNAWKISRSKAGQWSFFATSHHQKKSEKKREKKWWKEKDESSHSTRVIGANVGFHRMSTV